MEWIKHFEKKVELHRHLEGSIPVDLLWKYRSELCPSFSNIETFRNFISQVSPMKSLGEVLEKFGIFQKAFYKLGPSFTEECTARVVEQAVLEGIDQLELRFSPHFMCPVDNTETNRTYPSLWDSHMESLLKGVEDATEVSRNYGPNSGIMSAKFCEKWRNQVHGFDFAAGETDYLIKDFDKTVELVHEMNLPITCHTGEGTPSKMILETIERYKPRRLGHAVSLADDNDLMERCIKEDILVECCPFSNYVTGCVKNLKDHPVKIYHSKGVPCSLNTDDPGLFQSDMNSEWEIAMKEIGFTKETLLEINENARRYSFFT